MVPPGVVTKTLAVPALPAGVVALMVVPIVEAPELTVMVTEAVLLVTVLPAASLMVMMG